MYQIFNFTDLGRVIDEHSPHPRKYTDEHSPY